MTRPPRPRPPSRSHPFRPNGPQESSPGTKQSEGPGYAAILNPCAPTGRENAKQSAGLPWVHPKKSPTPIGIASPIPSPPATSVTRPSRPCLHLSQPPPNPNGIASQSPGLACTTQAYPGSTPQQIPNPKGVASPIPSPAKGCSLGGYPQSCISAASTIFNIMVRICARETQAPSCLHRDKCHKSSPGRYQWCKHRCSQQS